VANVELTVVLRKLRVQGAPGPAGAPQQGAAPDGFLVTPDALLPFKGTFKDEYGLTDVSWAYQVEQVEFELFHLPTSGKADKEKVSDFVLRGDPAVYRPGMIVSGLHGISTGLGEGVLAPAYWGWMSRLLAHNLVTAKGPSMVGGSAPLEGFQAQLEERAKEAIPLAALESKLRGPAPRSGQMLRIHSLAQENGFDFQKHLRKLKVADPQREAQLHYRIKLAVSATDNNIETGPTKVTSKLPVTLLVVSEYELLAQILLEEEALRERLEKAVDRLKSGKTFLDEQIGKLSSPQPPLSLVGLRVSKVREFLSDSARDVREVSADYGRILKEMTVNRVTASRIDRVEKKIWQPLEDLTGGNGSFAETEAKAAKLSEGLEDDVARIKKAEDNKEPVDQQLLETNRPVHLKLATEARDQTARLIERLEEVLQNIGSELDERETIAFGIIIERKLRDEHNVLARERERLEGELIKGATSP
jgi:hypothetical protein